VRKRDRSVVGVADAGVQFPREREARRIGLAGDEVVERLVAGRAGGRDGVPVAFAGAFPSRRASDATSQSRPTSSTPYPYNSR